MSRFDASNAIDSLMAHSNSVQESYSNFLFPGHADTTNFKKDEISDELCNVAFDNLTERIGICNYIDFYDFPQLPNSCDSLLILHLKGGEASSWDYGQKLKKHLKHFFAKFQLSTIYGF